MGNDMQKADRALVKKMNQQLVLRIIQSRSPIARRDIARLSGLSRASVTGITGELIDLGLVEETGEIEQVEQAGRRPILLRLNPKAGYVVGVSLARYTFTCVLTDLEANILFSAKHNLPLDESSDARYNPESVIQSIIQAIDELLGETDITTEQLMGIGIGINGIVDYELGVSLYAPHYDWHNVPLAAPIASHFGVPVYLENDARALTTAEQLFGAGAEIDNFVAVVVGYGIGSGVVANGQIYRGGSGGAGEFGHIVLQPDGPLCSCGKRGCLEALAGVPAIISQLKDAIATGERSSLANAAPLTLDAIAEAADEGDALAVRIVSEAGRWLGLGMSALVNILNPDLFVISGEAVCLGRHFLEPVEAAMRENAFVGLTDSFQIVADTGGTEVWARGVASVVLSSLFTSGTNDRLFQTNDH